MERQRKSSRKREAILDVLRSTDTHPTAEWIYQKLKSEIPDLSLATVYRNVNMFKDDGLIISVGVFDGQERLDARVDDHAHFACSSCGRVMDVEGLEEELEIDSIARDLFEGEIDGHRLILFGRCPDCV